MGIFGEETKEEQADEIEFAVVISLKSGNEITTFGCPKEQAISQIDDLIRQIDSGEKIITLYKIPDEYSKIVASEIEAIYMAYPDEDEK